MLAVAINFFRKMQAAKELRIFDQSDPFLHTCRVQDCLIAGNQNTKYMKYVLIFHV